MLAFVSPTCILSAEEEEEESMLCSSQSAAEHCWETVRGYVAAGARRGLIVEKDRELFFWGCWCLALVLVLLAIRQDLDTTTSVRFIRNKVTYLHTTHPTLRPAHQINIARGPWKRPLQQLQAAFRHHGLKSYTAERAQRECRYAYDASGRS